MGSMTSSPRPVSFGRRALPAVAIVGVSGALFTHLDHPTGVVAGSTPAARTSSATAKAAGSGATRAAGAVVTERGATRGSASVAPATTIDPPPISAGTLPRRILTTATAAPAAAVPAPTSAATASAAGASVGAGAGAACGAATVGPVVDTRWGPVQVAAGFAADGTLCSASAAQTPNSHRKSVQINTYAVPVLNQETMAARSAAIDVVSGATITSDAYAQSLQSLLDTKG